MPFPKATAIPDPLLAVVQPRSGLLVDLQALAGVAGEISYPTNWPDARVFHNGVAGQAKTCWAGGGTGARITASVAGTDSYTAPPGVSIGFLELTGVPSDAVTLIFDAAQNYGPVAVMNSTGQDVTTDAGGVTITSASSRIIARTDSNGLFVAISANTPI